MIQDSTHPTARVAETRGRSWSWALPVAAIAFAIFLGFETLSSRGAAISVLAREGHGIKAGDPLRYLGIQVGEVEEVHLAEDLSGIRMRVRLDPAASALARSGSRFWIVRPHLSLDSVEGLETIVGARYLACVPGALEGDRKTAFHALEEPPVDERTDTGGTEIVLEAPSRFGLAPGAPVSYRQIQIGTVLSVDLASDAASVEVHAYVRPEYRQLVCQNSRFWSTGGLDVRLGLVRGLRVAFESARSLLVGGIAMATPEDAGSVVESGMRYRLHEEPEEDWLEWRPSRPVGATFRSAGAGLPVPLKAELRWEQGMFKRNKASDGWLIPVEGGMIGPLNVLVAPEEARDGSVTFSMGDLEILPEMISVSEPHMGLGFLSYAGEDSPVAWPRDRMRTMGEPEDYVLISNPANPSLALSPNRLTSGRSGWSVDPSLPIDDTWHGAAVVTREGGLLVGILLVEEDEATIVGLPEAWTQR